MGDIASGTETELPEGGDVGKDAASATRLSSKKRLLENILSLVFLQGANYILPLITVPYLTRVLNPDGIGLIASAQSFIQYFVVLSDYGFNLTATRRIAIHRDDPEKVSAIFSSVMFVKLCLLLVSFLIVSTVALTVPKFKETSGTTGSLVLLSEFNGSRRSWTRA